MALCCEQPVTTTNNVLDRKADRLSEKVSVAPLAGQQDTAKRGQDSSDTCDTLDGRGKDLCPSRTVCRLHLFALIFDFGVSLHAMVNKTAQDPREPSPASAFCVHNIQASTSACGTWKYIC